MSHTPSEVYTREIPQVWDELAGMASELAARHGYATKAASGLQPEVARLDDEALSEAFYYGLGTVMVTMAAQLAEPDVTKNVITHTADSVWDTVTTFDPDRAKSGIRICDLRPAILAPAFPILAVNTVKMLPEADRLLANMLGVVRSERKELSTRIGASDPTTVLRQVDKTIRAESTGSQVGSGTLGGITRLMLFSLQTKQTGRIEAPSWPVDDAPALREFMSDEDVRKLKLGGIARSLARLRLDELMSDTVLTSLLSVGSDRELKFNKELLDTTPPPLPEIGTRRIIHSKRLGCPAIHVANLIDLIIDIEKDIVVDLKNR